jgi:hypothetical protein
MDRAEIAEKARTFEGQSRADLHAKWIAARQRSGLGSRMFQEMVHALKNVTDGRCPDGCCGNEDEAPWKPTPGEWVALAEEEARRTSERAQRTGVRR